MLYTTSIFLQLFSILSQFQRFRIFYPYYSFFAYFGNWKQSNNCKAEKDQLWIKGNQKMPVWPFLHFINIDTRTHPEQSQRMKRESIDNVAERRSSVQSLSELERLTQKVLVQT